MEKLFDYFRMPQPTGSLYPQLGRGPRLDVVKPGLVTVGFAVVAANRTVGAIDMAEMAASVTWRAVARTVIFIEIAPVCPAD